MAVVGYLSGLVSIGVIALTIVITKRLLYKRDKSGKRSPPSVGCFPIIGSIPYLPDAHELHLWCLEKSSQLGPVFSFTVGTNYTVMLTNQEVIQEALVQRSRDYPDRVKHFGNSIMNPNAKGIVFHQYNEDFKKYHQLTLSILRDLGFGQSSMEMRICTEIELILNQIISYDGEPFYPRYILECGAYNVISRMVFGTPLDDSSERDKRLLELLGLINTHFVALIPMDTLPLLRFMPQFRKKIHSARVYTIELMDLIDQKINETLQLHSDETFVSYFMEKDGEKPDIEQLRYTVRDLIFAGSETISSTIQWALLLLANYPDVQRRIQTEIDLVVQRDRLPSLGDMKSLKYVEAVILELMRYKTVGHLGLSHLTMRDTQVGGYFIPKNTIVWTILYAAHMDEKTWIDPTVFRPERFLDADENIINKDLMIAYALGKRSCIGEVMARQEIFLFFTCLLQKFNILPPDGVSQIDETDHVEMIITPCLFKVRCLQRNAM